MAVPGGRPAGELVYARAGTGEGRGAARAAQPAAVRRGTGADDACPGYVCGEATARAGAAGWVRDPVVADVAAGGLCAGGGAGDGGRGAGGGAAGAGAGGRGVPAGAGGAGRAAGGAGMDADYLLCAVDEPADGMDAGA